MNQMTVLFIGAARRHGTSAKTGSSYDICELFYGHPLEGKRTDNYKYEVYGCEQRSLRLAPEALDSFEKVQFGEEVVIELSPDPNNPMRNICTGVL